MGVQKVFVSYIASNMVPTWKSKKGKTSKFVDAGGYNRNEREGGFDDLEWVDREGWRRKIKL